MSPPGFAPIVSSTCGDETIRWRDETISCFRADIRKRPLAIKAATKRRPAPIAETGDSQMQTLSFIIAFALVVAAPSLAGSAESSLPGVGTFAYSGSSVANSAPQAIVVATR
jgi:hypothetical protein